MKTTFSEEYQQITNALIAARKERDLRQADIAEKLGKPQSFVAKYEGRERRLDVVEFVSVCRAVGVSPVLILQKAGLVGDIDLKT